MCGIQSILMPLRLARASGKCLLGLQIRLRCTLLLQGEKQSECVWGVLVSPQHSPRSSRRESKSLCCGLSVPQLSCILTGPPSEGKPDTSGEWHLHEVGGGQNAD